MPKMSELPKMPKIMVSLRSLDLKIKKKKEFHNFRHFSSF
jgi:hypothetical protein